MTLSVQVYTLTILSACHEMWSDICVHYFIFSMWSPSKSNPVFSECPQTNVGYQTWVGLGCGILFGYQFSLVVGHDLNYVLFLAEKIRKQSSWRNGRRNWNVTEGMDVALQSSLVADEKISWLQKEPFMKESTIQPGTMTNRSLVQKNQDSLDKGLPKGGIQSLGEGKEEIRVTVCILKVRDSQIVQPLTKSQEK